MAKREQEVIKASDVGKLDLATTEPASDALALRAKTGGFAAVGAAAGGVGKRTAEEFAAKVAREGRSIEMVMPLEDEGSFIAGILLGAGPDVEVTNIETGKPDPVPTYRVRTGPNMVYLVMAKHQIRIELAPLLKDPPGTWHLDITRGITRGQKGRARQVTQYFVLKTRVEELEGGKSKIVEA